MSFTITHTCGHDSQVRKMKDDWKANGICPDCYIEQQNSNVKAVSASDDLPALEGSEAQVNWAMKIRLDWIKDIRRNGVKHAEAVAMAALETSAKFWIEHRSLFVKILGILDTRLDEIEAVAAPVEAATQVAEKAPPERSHAGCMDCTTKFVWVGEKEGQDGEYEMRYICPSCGEHRDSGYCDTCIFDQDLPCPTTLDY